MSCQLGLLPFQNRAILVDGLLDCQTMSVLAQFWQVVRRPMDLYAHQYLCILEQWFMLYEQNIKGYIIGNLSVDCDHPLHLKVMFVMHAKNLQLIGILLLDNPQ
jgi:hypothetical protein